VGLGVGIPLLILLLLAIAWALWERKKRTNEERKVAEIDGRGVGYLDTKDVKQQQMTGGELDSQGQPHELQ
jgi:hypothetical protein